MKIPFLSLHNQYEHLRPEIQAAVNRVLESGRYLLGNELEAFEKEFAAFCGARFCVGVGSGLDALILGLKALDIGPGDEVITTPNSFIATTLAIVHAGAKPVFVDIEPDTLLMDVSLIEEKITPSTRAILPVHLFGQMVDMTRVREIARAHNLMILEDAAPVARRPLQRFGARRWIERRRIQLLSWEESRRLRRWRGCRDE